MKLSKLLLSSLCGPGSDLAGQLDGRLQGEIHLQGKAALDRSTQGAGSIKINGGRFRQYPMLQMVGRVLRTEELDTIELKDADALFEVRNSALLLQSLDLVSQNLQLHAKGTIQPDRTLDLQCQLRVNQIMFKKLPSETRENFRPIPQSTDQGLDFQVDGTTRQPRTDFMKRLIGDRLQKRMRNFLDSFLGNEAEGKPAPTPKAKSKSSSKSSPSPTSPTPKTRK